MSRAKFRCNSVEFQGDPGIPETVRTFKFSAVYDNTIPEDERFNIATPWAELKINVSNAAVTFTVGSFYYADLSPAG